MNTKKSELRIGVILNYINMVLGNLIPILYTPIMLGLLGQSEYGLYKLSSSVTSYLSLMSLGISSAVTRYLVKYRVEGNKEKVENVLGLFMLIFRVIAILSFAIGMAIALKLEIWYGASLVADDLHKMKILVFLMVCNMSIGFLLSPYISVVTAYENFIFVQTMNIITTCIAPLLNLVMLYAGLASVGMAISSLAINVFVQLMYFLYVRYQMNIKANCRNSPIYMLKEILDFSFWVFVSNVVGQLYNATDTVMIGSVPGLATSGTAIYNVGIVFVNIIGAMSTGLSSVLAPKTNRMIFEGKSNTELTDFSIKIGRIQAFIVSLIVTGFIAFGRPFIYFYAGKEYELSYWVAILIMIPNMIPPLQNVCLNIIIAQNKHRFRSLVYLGIAILNVIGTWLLLKTMGIVGAALMTGIALFIGTGIIMNFYYWKAINLDIQRFWKEVGRIFIIPCIMCVITNCFAKFINLYKIETMLLGIIIYALIFFIINWIYVMNDYEKELVSSLFRVVLKNGGNNER